MIRWQPGGGIIGGYGISFRYLPGINNCLKNTNNFCFYEGYQINGGSWRIILALGANGATLPRRFRGSRINWICNPSRSQCVGNINGTRNTVTGYKRKAKYVRISNEISNILGFTGRNIPVNIAQISLKSLTGIRNIVCAWEIF